MDEKWARTEGGWMLESGSASLTDEAIRVFGRKHLERLLRQNDLPALPEEAWAVDGK